MAAKRGRQTGHPRGTARPRTRAARVRRRSRNQLALVCAALVAVVGIVAVTVARHCCAPVRGINLLYIGEKTSQTAGRIPTDVQKRIGDIVTRGEPGTLDVYAIGRTAAPAGRIALQVLRAGVPESNSDLRLEEVGRRLAALAGAVADARVGDRGFDLYAALQIAEDESRNGRREVWLATTVLSGSVPPLDMARLTAADPAAAVEDVMKTAIGKIDLSRVDLHPLLLTPMNPGREPLGAEDQAWREEFITGLGRALGAHVVPPVRDLATAAPWPRSAAAGLAKVEQRPFVRNDRIDAGYFHPNQAVLLSVKTAERWARKIADRYANSRTGSTVHVTGFCARFGNREGARHLSLLRARVIADLLSVAGVPRAAIRVEGAGWDRRADPGKPPTDKAQRVVTVQIAPPGE